jgi:hypothetical protein
MDDLCLTFYRVDTFTEYVGIIDRQRCVISGYGSDMEIVVVNILFLFRVYESHPLTICSLY